MLTSVHAHADIRGIDLSAALTAPGVVEILTGADWIADGLGPVPHNLGFSSPPDIALQNRDGTDRYVAPHFPLPADRVRHVGQPFAMVIAETFLQARDAAELVEVDFDILAPAIDTDRAADDSASVVWPDLGTNVAIDADVNNLDETAGILADAAQICGSS